MRLGPIVTAFVVALVVYAFVMERDWLRAIAGAEQALVEPPAETATEPEVLRVVTELITPEPVVTAVTMRGRTEAWRRVEVMAETSGRVIGEPARRGAQVAAGDLLCQLDPGPRAAQLAEAEARLAEAEANDRAATQLSERGFAAETTRLQRQAALQAASAAVEQARRELDRLEIRAPFAGVLDADAAELGTLLQPGTPCATVIQLDPVRLVGFVSERDVERIEAGAEAGARLASGRMVTGTVTFVSRIADPQTRTFRVEVEVPNPDLSIRDGQSAEILISRKGENGHAVPQSALTLDDDGRLGIRAAEGDIARFHPVSILREANGRVFVAGLDGPVEVIVVGQEFVRDGRAIRAERRAEAE